MKSSYGPLPISRPLAEDDAGRDGPAEAEGIADREHPVTDPGLAVGPRLRETGSSIRPSTLIKATSVRASVADHLGGEVVWPSSGRHFDLCRRYHTNVGCW